MKANVQISAVKKEFKNGQQGWQVFVDGMEGRLRCEMNFKDALKAIRYSFLLSKRLNLQINDIQLAALSLDYQRAKDAVAKVVEDAAQAANEAAATAGAEACDSASSIESGSNARAQAGSNEVQQEESSDESEGASEKAEDAAESPLFKQFCDLKKKHPDALLLFRHGDFYECYEEDAITAAAVLALTEVRSTSDNITMAGFPYHALDSYLPKLIRAGHRVAICDELEAPKGKAEVEDIKPAPKKRSKKQAS